MRIVFFGTPQVAVPSLRALHEARDVDVVAVVTNPDRARGRSRTPRPSPVKVAAEEFGIEVLQPWPAADVAPDLERLAPDACAVVAYGSILRPEVLALGGAGFVNLHFSLLPRWRGAAPVQHALIAGDTQTGVTAFRLDEGMDTGPVLASWPTPIDPAESAGDLLERLAVDGAPTLVEAMRDLVAGVEPVAQDDRGVTIASKLGTDDARLDLTRPADRVVDLIRGVTPAPGAHTTWQGDRFKVHAARVSDLSTAATPGTIVALESDGPAVATGAGVIVLTRVQPAGKGAMDGGAWCNGYRPDVGAVFG